MLRHCSNVDWEKNDMSEIMRKGLSKEPCGVIYDDDERSIVCPHDKLPPAEPKKSKSKL